MEKKAHKNRTAIELLQDRIAELGISLTELAARSGEHVQTLSAIMHGRRVISIPLSIKLDAALGFAPGTLAQAQTKDQVQKAGGLWSYQGIPEHLDDDSIIEAALVHLDLEDMPKLFQIWSKAHIKRVWKERLVSQGRRMNILNYILAVKVFNVNHPDNYIARYARQ